MNFPRNRRGPREPFRRCTRRGCRSATTATRMRLSAYEVFGCDRTSREPPATSLWLTGAELVILTATYGQLPVPDRAVEDRQDAAGHSLHRRQRGGRAVQLLRHELDPGDLHDQ